MKKEPIPLRFPIMDVPPFSYVWIPESLTIWERANDSVYHLSHLFIPTGILWAEFGI